MHTSLPFILSFICTVSGNLVSIDYDHDDYYNEHADGHLSTRNVMTSVTGIGGVVNKFARAAEQTFTLGQKVRKEPIKPDTDPVKGSFWDWFKRNLPAIQRGMTWFGIALGIAAIIATFTLTGGTATIFFAVLYGISIAKNLAQATIDVGAGKSPGHVVGKLVFNLVAGEVMRMIPFQIDELADAAEKTGDMMWKYIGVFMSSCGVAQGVSGVVTGAVHPGNIVIHDTVYTKDEIRKKVLQLPDGPENMFEDIDSSAPMPKDATLQKLKYAKMEQDDFDNDFDQGVHTAGVSLVPCSWMVTKCFSKACEQAKEQGEKDADAWAAKVQSFAGPDDVKTTGEERTGCKANSRAEHCYAWQSGCAECHCCSAEVFGIGSCGKCEFGWTRSSDCAAKGANICHNRTHQTDASKAKKK